MLVHMVRHWSIHVEGDEFKIHSTPNDWSTLQLTNTITLDPSDDIMGILASGLVSHYLINDRDSEMVTLIFALWTNMVNKMIQFPHLFFS